MTLLLGRRGLLRAGLGRHRPARPARHGLRRTGGEPRGALLILVYLRGGMDGLHFLSPADDRDFVELRTPSAAHRRRGRAGRGAAGCGRPGPISACIPKPPPLAGIWREGRMAIWPAAGVPQPTRSHFEAQAIMGWGQGLRSDPAARTGWLAAWAEATGGTAPVITLSGQDRTGGGADRRPARPGSADPGARAGDAGRRLRRGDAGGAARRRRPGGRQARRRWPTRRAGRRWPACAASTGCCRAMPPARCRPMRLPTGWITARPPNSAAAWRPSPRSPSCSRA